MPKLSVIVRKAYGAGLYAMAGPAFDPDATLALPTAKIAVMGPSAAVNAVFYNQLQAIEDEQEREARRAELMEEYAEGVDLLKLASEMVIDAIVQPEDLRDELVRRFARYQARRASGRPSATRFRPRERRGAVRAADRPRGAVPARVDGHARGDRGRPAGARERARLDARPLHRPGLAAARAAARRAAAERGARRGRGRPRGGRRDAARGRARRGEDRSRVDPGHPGARQREAPRRPRVLGALAGPRPARRRGGGARGARGSEDPLRRHDAPVGRGGRGLRGGLPRRRRPVQGHRRPAPPDPQRRPARVPQPAGRRRVRGRRSRGPILAEEDPDAFTLDERGFGVHGHHADAETIAAARAELFVAYGSCSFDEPAGDLVALGLL